MCSLFGPIPVVLLSLKLSSLTGTIVTQGFTEPYLMTPLEQQFYNFRLGRDYPYPIVDHKEARSKASEILWGLKKDPVVLRESQRILAKHTLKDRKPMLRDDS